MTNSVRRADFSTAKGSNAKPEANGTNSKPELKNPGKEKVLIGENITWQELKALLAETTGNEIYKDRITFRQETEKVFLGDLNSNDRVALLEQAKKEDWFVSEENFVYVPTEWVYSWDSKERIKVRMHLDVFNTVKEHSENGNLHILENFRLTMTHMPEEVKDNGEVREAYTSFMISLIGTKILGAF